MSRIDTLDRGRSTLPDLELWLRNVARLGADGQVEFAIPWFAARVSRCVAAFTKEGLHLEDRVVPARCRKGR